MDTRGETDYLNIDIKSIDTRDETDLLNIDLSDSDLFMHQGFTIFIRLILIDNFNKDPFIYKEVIRRLDAVK